MEVILIEPKNEEEKQKVENILNELGIKNSLVPFTDEQRRYLAGLQMIEIAKKHPKFDISDEEIAQMGKNIEAEIYARFKL